MNMNTQNNIHNIKVECDPLPFSSNYYSMMKENEENYNDLVKIESEETFIDDHNDSVIKFEMVNVDNDVNNRQEITIESDDIRAEMKLEKARKGARCPNFTKREEAILVTLIKKYKNIIEIKEANSIANETKLKIWKKLTEEFNTTSGETPRDLWALKNKYSNLKKRTKQNYSKEKAYIIDMGSSPSQITPVINVEEELKEILGKRLNGNITNFDSNAEQSCEVSDVPSCSNIQEEMFESDSQVESNEDSSVATNKNLQKPISTTMRNKRKRDVQSQLSNWVKAKEHVQEANLRFLEEEHKLKMKHLQEKHDKDIEERNLRIEIMRNKYELEKKLLLEEHKQKLFNLKQK